MTTTQADGPTDPIKTLLILGASGDLTGRLLLPGLARLLAKGRAKGIALVGASSDDWSREKWRERVKASFADSVPEPDAGARAEIDRVAGASEYHRVDVTAAGALASLLKELEGPVAVYFALPPAISQKACEILAPDDLPAGTRLVLEKPFGSDVASARSLNATLAGLVAEDHIHRVDHFLGNSTIFNILGLRFANHLFEPVWNNRHIEKIEIFYDEDLALEGRARYYDTAGALRDMIQSHLLQIMALLALEPPASIDERDLRDAIGIVLRASSIDPAFAESTRRARYTAGKVGEREVPSYVDEEGIDPSLKTETLAEVQVSIDNWRWAGVPFVLRSGKALGDGRKEALITFKPVPHLPGGFGGTDSPTRLRIGFEPNTLGLQIDVNGPGDMFALDRVELAASLNESDLLPYGEVLDGILNGDPLLSVRGDTAEECWRIVGPTLAAWAADEVELEEYAAGSPGPDSWATTKAAD